MRGGELWLVAGPNGAGKTTLIQREPLCSWIAPATVLNADDATLRMLREAGYEKFSDVPSHRLREIFISAADAVYEEAEDRLFRGECVCLETVLSTDKFCSLVERLLAAGGRFHLLYVAVSSVDVSRERVAHRASQGGHDVPTDKLTQRWGRSMTRVGWFAKRAHLFIAFDNTDSHAGNAPRIIAKAYHGVLRYLDDTGPLPFVDSLRDAFCDS